MLITSASVNSGVHFLLEEIFGLLHGPTSFEKHQCPECLFFPIAELLWGQVYIQDTGVEEYIARTPLSMEV